MINNKKGLVVVYTGNGKGKTTAALGIILRSLGYDKKVLLVQFGKNSFSGELTALKKFGSQVKIIQGGLGFVGILGDNKKIDEHRISACKTLGILEREMLSGKWDLVVADEIIGAVIGSLIDEADLLNLIALKPDNIDFVLTGRRAGKELIEKADLVTEMKKVKHPYEKGIKAKKGIDF
jgi:cob(I)alamin adenosyltransferase